MMKIGEHVAFKSSFLKSITGHEMANLRGFVYRLDGMIAAVRWINGDGPDHVLVSNITPVSRLQFHN